jgi:hypothetical protein
VPVPSGSRFGQHREPASACLEVPLSGLTCEVWPPVPKWRSCKQYVKIQFLTELPWLHYHYGSISAVYCKHRTRHIISLTIWGQNAEFCNVRPVVILVLITVLNKGCCACSINRLRICELDWIVLGYGQVVAFLMTLWLNGIVEFLVELNTNSCSIDLA